MPYACKFCIAAKGLNGSDIDSLPRTFEEAARHVEQVHRYAVPREGESYLDAVERLIAQLDGPVYGARFALRLALGRPHNEAAEIIHATGAVIEVNALQAED